MEIVIAAIVGLIVGLLIGWYLWARQVSGYRNQVADVRASLDRKDRNAAGLETRLKEQEATIDNLRAQLSPDDLAVLEGIGPKIQAVLYSKGIHTFKQLAATPVSRLEQILKEADLPFTDPGTWPEQAQLAAAGDWAQLEVLTGQLKSGRRMPSTPAV